MTHIPHLKVTLALWKIQEPPLQKQKQNKTKLEVIFDDSVI